MNKSEIIPFYLWMKSLLMRPQLDRDYVKIAVFVFVGVVWGTGRVGGRLMFVMFGTCDDCVFGGPSVTFCHGFRLRHAAIRSSLYHSVGPQSHTVYDSGIAVYISIVLHSVRLGISVNNTVIAPAGTTGILSQYRPPSIL